MFRLNLGSSRRYCDGLSRRNFLQLGVAGMAAVGLPELARAKEASSGQSKSGRGTSVILLWLDGGPSHIDTYDMKPDAPAEYRGLWKPIRTKVAGFDITELFPKQAKLTDKFSVVRSLHHDTGDHFAGAHRMITTKEMGVSGANTAPKFPGIGAIVNREVGARCRGLPGHVAAPHSASVGLVPGYFGGQMLGAEHDPFVTGDPSTPNFQVRSFNLAAGLTLQKLEDRRTLLNHFDKSQAHLAKHRTAVSQMNVSMSAAIRRQFLGMAGSALALSAIPAAEPKKRPKVATIFTAFTYRSHAHVNRWASTGPVGSGSANSGDRDVVAVPLVSGGEATAAR